MSLLSRIRDVRALISGTPFGYVEPARTPPSLLAVDGRTSALRVLARYIAALEFQRPGDKGGAPIAYRIPFDDVHIGWPDNVEKLKFPSVVFQSGEAAYESTGLTAYLDEATADKFGKGTVLQTQSEFTEVFQIIPWATKRAERASLMAGFEQALVPTEQMYGIRFTIPDYYDETVCFSLWGSSRPDTDEAARNRRWGILNVQMRFNQVALVNYNRIRPYASVEAFDGSLAIQLGDDTNDGTGDPETGG